MSAVFRVYKNGNYTTVSNVGIFDKTLSWKAKGLLVTMLALPPDWQYSKEGLSSLSKGGITVLENALSELQEHGYVVIRKNMPDETESGRIEYSYFTFEEPVSDIIKQYIEKQDPEKLPLVFLDLEKQALLNINVSSTNVLNTNEIEKKDINSSNDSFISKEKPKRSAGIMPSKEEVDAYIAKKGYHFSSEEFLKYYTNDGELDVLRFKDGKLVKDWHRCCVTFEDNWKRRNGDQPAHKEEKPFNQFETDWDDPELQRARKKQMERAAERRRLRSEQQPAV